MNAIDQLKSVLCDPTGKCCITGSDKDREIVDQALQALAQPAQDLSRLKPFVHGLGQAILQEMMTTPPAAAKEKNT